MEIHRLPFPAARFRKHPVHPCIGVRAPISFEWVPSVSHGSYLPDIPFRSSFQHVGGCWQRRCGSGRDTRRLTFFSNGSRGDKSSRGLDRLGRGDNERWGGRRGEAGVAPAASSGRLAKLEQAERAAARADRTLKLPGVDLTTLATFSRSFSTEHSPRLPPPSPPSRTIAAKVTPLRDRAVKLLAAAGAEGEGGPLAAVQFFGVALIFQTFFPELSLDKYSSDSLAFRRCFPRSPRPSLCSSFISQTFTPREGAVFSRVPLPDARRAVPLLFAPESRGGEGRAAPLRVSPREPVTAVVK